MLSGLRGNRMNVQEIKTLTVTATLLMSLVGCQPHDQTAETQTKTVNAQTILLSLTDIPVADATPGTIVAEQQVQVASRLMGYIHDIAVHEGEAVKAGQLLFSIDPTDIKGQVDQARAGLAQAEAALNDAKADYERFSNLYKEESIPKAQYDKIKLQYNIAQSQANAAKAGMNTAESQLHYAAVRSPINGIVTQKMANKGELAVPGRPVLVVENPDKLTIQTSVSDETYSHLQMGGAATVEVGTEKLPGKIVRLVSAADAMSHTHLVKLDVPGIKGFSSGTFARVRFTVGSRKGISLPKSALLERAGISGVFVVDSNNIARYRMVRAGGEQDGLVEIEAGLNSGDKIVVSNTAELNSGDKINLTGINP